MSREHLVISPGSKPCLWPMQRVQFKVYSPISGEHHVAATEVHMEDGQPICSGGRSRPIQGVGQVRLGVKKTIQKHGGA